MQSNSPINYLLEKAIFNIKRNTLEKISNANEIYITEILATCDPGIKGEFDFDSNSTMDKKNKPTKIKDESDADLIKRMFEQIEVLASYAKDIHLNRSKNVSVSQSINPLNHVTCISTSEFFFYPNKERGALTEDNFLDLIKMIEKLAENLPENLHLLLATFPLRNNNNFVFNVAVYVQCGSTPNIHITTKSCPSNVDLIYPGTINPSLCSEINSKSTHNELLKLHEQFKEHYTSNNQSMIFNETIPSLISLLETEQNLTNITMPNNLIDIVNSLKTAKNDLMFFLTKINGTKDDLSISEITYNEFINHSLNYYVKVNELYKGMQNEMIRAVATSAPISVSHSTNIKLNISYEGSIHCVANGIPFIRTIEICLDNAAMKAAHNLKQIFRLNLQTSNTTLTYLSQILTSNTIRIQPNSQINNSRRITHVDPSIKNMGRLIHEEILSPIFGQNTLIKIYTPEPLQKIASPKIEEINSNNELAIYLQACRLCVTQHPYHKIEIDKLINHRIYQFISVTLSHPSLKSITYDKLIHDILVNLALKMENASAFRNDAIHFLNEKIEIIDIKNINGRELLKVLETISKLLKQIQHSEELEKEEIDFVRKLHAYSIWKLPSPKEIESYQCMMKLN